jgi:hypothetical protein
MDNIGYEWLRRSFDLTAFEVSPPASVRPVARISEQSGVLAVPAQSAPALDNALGHILFALKHEGTNLQILSQALPRVTAIELQDAVRANPNGRYLRIAASLWERFTQQELPEPPVQTSAYVDVFSPDLYITTDKPLRDSRWRVNFNGLGSLNYCATVRRTPAIERGIALDIPLQAREFMQTLPVQTRERTLTLVSVLAFVFAGGFHHILHFFDPRCCFGRRQRFNRIEECLAWGTENLAFF